MRDLLISSSIAHSLLLVVPIGMALLLRWARCPGWRVAGGVLAGLLLGPSVLGRIMPEHYESWLIGGQEERAALGALLSRQGADLLALETAGAPRSDIESLRREQQVQWIEARRALDDARWHHQRPLRSYTALMVSLTLLGGGLISVRGRDRRQGWTTPLSIGLWAAALPGGLGFFAMRFWGDSTVAESVLAASILAVGPWALTAIDRQAADQVEFGGARMIQTAGRVASLIAVASAMWALWSIRGLPGLLWSLPLLAIIAGWLLPVRDVRLVREILNVMLIPNLAACATMKVDLFADASLWPIVVFVLLSGDGRWTGAFLGALTPGGRKTLRTMRLVLGSMACGPAQLAILAVAVQTGAIPGSAAFALALGAIAIEVLAPARRVMARKLAETEEELERLEHEE